MAINFSKVVTTARGVKATTTTTVEQGSKNSSSAGAKIESLHKTGSLNNTGILVSCIFIVKKRSA